MTIISILLMKMIVIKESFSRRPVHCRNNTSNTLTLLYLLMILGNSLYKRSMSFAKSWIALTPHWIGSLNIRSGVASENIRVLARPSLTSSLYRLKVSKSWRWMPQTRPAIMAQYLSRFLKTALTNSYRPFPTWLIFRSVAGHFPDIWKEGLVIKVKDYRLVSNLACLSKITEKVWKGSCTTNLWSHLVQSDASRISISLPQKSQYRICLTADAQRPFSSTWTNNESRY